MVDTGKAQSLVKNVLAACVATAGSAVPHIVSLLSTRSTQTLAQSDILIALGVGSATVASSVFGTRLSNALFNKSNEPEIDGDDLVNNGDWCNLTALAASEVIKQSAKTTKLYDAEREMLLKLAEAVKLEWDNVSTIPDFDGGFSDLEKERAIEWFHTAARENEKERRALDIKTWKNILEPIAKSNRCFSSAELLNLPAKALHETLPQAVYQILKDPKHDSREFRGLIMTMMKKMHEVLINLLPTLSDTIKTENYETRKQITTNYSLLTDVISRRQGQGLISELYHWQDELELWAQFLTRLYKFRANMGRNCDLVDQYRMLASDWNERDQFDNVIKMLYKGLAIAEGLKNDNGRAASVVIAALLDVFQTHGGDLDETGDSLSRLLAFDGTGDATVCWRLCNACIIFGMRNKFDIAENMLNRSLTLCQTDQPQHVSRNNAAKPGKPLADSRSFVARTFLFDKELRFLEQSRHARNR